MLRVVFAVMALGLTIFALLDLWQVPAGNVRGGSRFLWTVAILLLPVIGAALWLIFGRAPEDGPDHRFLGPDDDPDFLRGIRPR
ncbi:MAG TPA: PLD nuclease N-terminal domain-containing protein [Actinomycetota bacterium]|nr:PLD nuclease N-terminal domain-containing protein [Actinomycetota bacterium]